MKGVSHGLRVSCSLHPLRRAEGGAAFETRTRLLPSWVTAGRGSGAEGWAGLRSQGRSTPAQVRVGVQFCKCQPLGGRKRRGKWAQPPAALTSSPALTSSLTSRCPCYWLSEASGSVPPQCLCTAVSSAPRGLSCGPVGLLFITHLFKCHSPEKSPAPSTLRPPAPIRLPDPQHVLLPCTCPPLHVPWLILQYLSPPGHKLHGDRGLVYLVRHGIPCSKHSVWHTAGPTQHSAEPWTCARHRPMGRNSLTSDPR